MRISDWSSVVCSSDLTPRAALSPGIRSWQAPRDAAPRPRCIPRPLSVCAMIRGYSGLGAVLDQAEEVPAPTTAASPAPEPPQQAAPAAAPPPADEPRLNRTGRSEEHTSELQSLMRISYAVFCLKKKKT